MDSKRRRFRLLGQIVAALLATLPLGFNLGVQGETLFVSNPQLATSAMRLTSDTAGVVSWLGLPLLVFGALLCFRSAEKRFIRRHPGAGGSSYFVGIGALALLAWTTFVVVFIVNIVHTESIEWRGSPSTTAGYSDVYWHYSREVIALNVGALLLSFLGGFICSQANVIVGDPK